MRRWRRRPRARNSRPGSRRRTGGCGIGRTGCGCRGRPAPRSPRRPSARGWSGRSSRGGSARSSPARPRSGGPCSSSGTSRASSSRSHRWRSQAPFSPIVFSSLRSRSAHFSAQKSANSGAIHQAVDQLGPLLGVGIGEERAGLGRVGEPADGVEIGPAEEDLVVGRRRGIDPEGLEPGIDVPVDRVLGSRRPARRIPGGRPGTPAGWSPARCDSGRRSSPRPGRVACTNPSSVTSNRAGSLTSYAACRVTSRAEPSSSSAVATSCCDVSPGGGEPIGGEDLRAA